MRVGCTVLVCVQIKVDKLDKGAKVALESVPNAAFVDYASIDFGGGVRLKHEGVCEHEKQYLRVFFNTLTVIFFTPAGLLSKSYKYLYIFIYF